MKQFIIKLSIFVLSISLSVLNSCTSNNSATEKTSSVEQDSTSQLAGKLIQDFYSRYVLGREELNDDNAKDYLTAKLIGYLHHEYQNEYDGDGLAVWKFRTGYQDGPGSSSIEILSFDESNSCATVKIMDMGFPAKGQIFIIKEDKELKIDSISVNTINE